MSTTRSVLSSRPWTPRDYQLDGIKFLLEHACAGLFLRPGLGKSSITLAALTILKKRSMLGKVLLVAPLRPVYDVWPGEIEKWLDFNHLTYAICHEASRAEMEKICRQDVDIVLINPEGLESMLDPEVHVKHKMVMDPITMKLVEKEYKDKVVNRTRFKKLGFSMLIVDELSKFKHHDTQRFKMLKQVLDTFDRRWGLTGSPAANGLLDLFGQCFILDMGNALGRYVTHYRRAYFDSDRYQHKWTLRPGADQLIYERIKPLVLQMGYEHLKMPDLLVNDIYVDLPDDVMRFYLKMEVLFTASLEQGRVTALTAAAASTKIRQIASGGVYLDPEVLANGLQAPKSERKWVNLHSAKTDALRDLVDELQGDPLLVAYDFEHDLDRLRSKFKEGEFAEDYGMKEFRGLTKRWNSGAVPMLFGHPASIGHGLNLQGASGNVCWHTPTWNRDHYDQFTDRVWRQGNERPSVTVHRIIARNTIDEVIIGSCDSKGTVEEALFTGLRKLREARDEA